MFMAWSRKSDNSEMILYLKDVDGLWKPYNQVPRLFKPDYKIDKGSKGFATMQFLLKQGWKIVNEKEMHLESKVF